MAVRKLDGFDHYLTGDIDKKTTGLLNSPTIVTPGRFGGGMLSTANSNAGISDTFDAQATWILGVAFKTSAIGAIGVFSLLDGATRHVDLRVQTGTGLIQVTRNATVLGTSTTAITTNTWYYLELKTTINNTTGVAVVAINGVTEINLSSQDTQNAGNASANVVQIGGIAGTSATIQYDDYYIFDGTGSTANDINGPARVATFYSSEAGNSAQFTGTPGPNFSNVNNILMDDDSSFNYTSTANNIDSFKFTDPSITSGTATAYQHSITARTDGGGARVLAAHQRSSATNYAETGQALSASYKTYMFPRSTNPATSAAITATELKDAEFGYKLIS